MRLGDNNINEFKKVIDNFFKGKTKEEIQELVDKARGENKNENNLFRC